jgi:FKBP-type peptidyl-prolyl cis-trans isomerase SlyD
MDFAPTLVAENRVVSLDYTLTVDNEVIDSSGSTPLEYLQGHNNIIPGLERALTGLSVGQTREVTIAPEDAYGEYDPDGIYILPRSQFPPSFDLKIGAALRVRADNGRVLTASVIHIDENEVKIDLNHPLAGKTLHFRATIAAVRPAAPEELAAGRVGGTCSSCGSSSSCSGACN